MWGQSWLRTCRNRVAVVTMTIVPGGFTAPAQATRRPAIQVLCSTYEVTKVWCSSTSIATVRVGGSSSTSVTRSQR
ncbi:hypothetical protein LUR56_39850 [Streptomyces sp. MT29]|nr:hypothetical protein [Streptomyces sp. MT29]